MKKIFSATMVAICLLLTQTSNAQIYISIDGVEGESQFRDFPNSTQIQSFSWGASNQAPASGVATGRSSSKLSIADFSITKARGAASAAIQMAVYGGKRITRAEIRFYGGAQNAVYLTIILEDVLITSWQISGSGSERPTESISLSALRVKTEENTKNPTGTSKPVKTGWDVATNAPITW